MNRLDVYSMACEMARTRRAREQLEQAEEAAVRKDLIESHELMMRGALRIVSQLNDHETESGRLTVRSDESTIVVIEDGQFDKAILSVTPAVFRDDERVFVKGWRVNHGILVTTEQQLTAAVVRIVSEVL